MTVVDSSGWIEYFRGSDVAVHFSEAIQSPAALIVPTVCIAEVTRLMLRLFDTRKALDAVAVMKQGIVVGLDEKIAVRAAILGITWKLPFADSIIYATARQHNANLLTLDKHFQDIPHVSYYSKT